MSPPGTGSCCRPRPGPSPPSPWGPRPPRRPSRPGDGRQPPALGPGSAFAEPATGPGLVVGRGSLGALRGRGPGAPLGSAEAPPGPGWGGGSPGPTPPGPGPGPEGRQRLAPGTGESAAHRLRGTPEVPIFPAPGGPVAETTGDRAGQHHALTPLRPGRSGRLHATGRRRTLGPATAPGGTAAPG